MSAPVVNFLHNVPLPDKQRLQLIYQFLRKQNPPLSLSQQISIAEILLPMWKRRIDQPLHDIWNFYKNGQKSAAPLIVKKEIPNTVQETKETPTKFESFSLNITLNSQQQLAVDYAKSGKSFVLTGAAGTGKTTTEREIVKTLLEELDCGTHVFKDKRTGDRFNAPGIAVVSFTNKAANTSRAAIHKDPWLKEMLPHNITTIHNFLEFLPEFFDKPDGTQGMRFIPHRNAFNPVDTKFIIIEEASTVGALDLYQFLFSAIRPGTVLILVGDINQLAPIFSPSILNYALTQLPVVELTEIYRQAQDSPIISNAWHILKGEKLEEKRPHFTVIGGANLDRLVGPSYCVQKLIGALKKWIDIDDPTLPGEKMYDPEQDIILSAYNVSDIGTIEINNHIAQFLGNMRNAIVHHIIAGRHTWHVAVGDRIFFYKKEAIIKKISINRRYIGKTPKPPGEDLTRWGVRLSNGKHENIDEDLGFSLEGYENMNVDDIPDPNEESSRRQAASHVINIEYVDDRTSDTIESAGEFAPANFGLGYAITVHKAQGSEWRKVFLMMHRSQMAHLHRELFYTAVTRARSHFILLDFNDVRDRVISQQKIKGNSLEEKIAWFNSEISLKEPVQVLKTI